MSPPASLQADPGSAGESLLSATSDRLSFKNRAWLLWLGMFLSLTAYSAIRSPVPSVNEPHYLGKARHYWQPDWCAGDLLLESSSPHQVFYQTAGLLTRWLTLTQAAWVGRILALAVLAWGLLQLMRLLCDSDVVCLPALWTLLLLHSLGNFSGEWLVGGVEAKVFAYGLACGGLAYLLRSLWWQGGLLLGVSVAMHPLVGGWAVVATTMTLAWGAFRRWGHIPWGRAAVALLCCAVTALPGVIPALASLRQADPRVATQADFLQVGLRLSHHLDPMVFPLTSYRYYALLLVIWLLLRTQLPADTRRRWFETFVLMSVVIALAGVLIGWGPRPIEEMPLAALRARLLKFYPFRLADVMVPLMLAVTGGVRVAHSLRRGTSSRRRALGWFTLALGAYLVSIVLPHVDRNPSRMSTARQTDWIAALSWVDDHAPADAFLYAANENWAVKWFANRAEYVSYKDCPQDAAGIVEWARRLRWLNQWSRESFADGRCSTDELAHLREETGITHLIASRFGPTDMTPVYRNESFRVYELPERPLPGP